MIKYYSMSKYCIHIFLIDTLARCVFSALIAITMPLESDPLKSNPD